MDADRRAVVGDRDQPTDQAPDQRREATNEETDDGNDDEPIRLQTLEYRNLVAERKQLFGHTDGESEIALPAQDGAREPGEDCPEHTSPPEAQVKADPAAGDQRRPDRDRHHATAHLMHQVIALRRRRGRVSSSANKIAAGMARAIVSA